MSPRDRLPELHVVTRAAWRAWLAEHHDRSPGVQLVFHRKETGEPTLEYEEAVCEAVCFGWIDGLIRKKDDTRYTRRFTPRKAGSSWSPSNKRRVARMEAEGLMTPAGRALVEAAKADGNWEAPDRVVIPDEPTPAFAQALDAHPEARAFFESLAPGYRRRYIAWIAVAKRPSTRERRIAEAVELLERGEKLGMR